MACGSPQRGLGVSWNRSWVRADPGCREIWDGKCRPAGLSGGDAGPTAGDNEDVTRRTRAASHGRNALPGQSRSVHYPAGDLRPISACGGWGLRERRPGRPEGPWRRSAAGSSCTAPGGPVPACARSSPAPPRMTASPPASPDPGTARNDLTEHATASWAKAQTGRGHGNDTRQRRDAEHPRAAQASRSWRRYA